MDFRRGEKVGDYVVEKVLGEGSVAVVYRVRHRVRATIHALKHLRVNQRVARQRLVLEGQIQARIDHPNVVRVTEILTVDDGIALVMEYVSGPTLSDWLARNEPEMEEALDLFAGMVRAIAVTHAVGAVHRDVKPGNFLVDGHGPDRVAKLTDFGLVKVLEPALSRRMTHTGAFLGSPAYMAPEQVRDPRQVDRRADMWSLGCILYELVCHRKAFDGADRVEICNKVVAGDYAEPETLVRNLPPAVGLAIAGLLNVDPTRRLGSCQELWELLFRDSRGALVVDAYIDEQGLERPSIASSALDTFMLPGSGLDARGAGAGSHGQWIVPLAGLLVLTAVVGAAWYAMAP